MFIYVQFDFIMIILQSNSGFLSANCLHYDYNEALEVTQTKLILYSLKNTHTPKLNLSRIMSYTCSL